jgi:hypothetical protein|tara:strand:+ start:385 stop:603 length:219 start_codon:yes stop_codon:yes gene_type:complete
MLTSRQAAVPATSRPPAQDHQGGHYADAAEPIPASDPAKKTVSVVLKTLFFLKRKATPHAVAVRLLTKYLKD